MSKQATYVLKLDGEISSLQGKLKTIQTAFDKMGGTKDTGVVKTLEGIDSALGRLREKANNPIITEATFGNLLKDSGAITAKLKELESVLDSVAQASESERFEFLSPETQNRIKTITNALKTYDDVLNQTIVKTGDQIKAEKELNTVLGNKVKLEGNISKNKKILSAAEKTIEATNEEIVAIKQRMEALGEEKDLLQKVNEARQAAQKISKGEAAEGYTTESIAAIEAQWAAYEEEKRVLEEKNTALKIATQTQEKYSKQIAQDTLKLEGLTAQYEELNTKVKNYEKAAKGNSTKAKNAAWKELRETAEQLGVSMEGIPIKRTEAGAAELAARLEALKQEGFAELTTEIEQTKAAMAEMNGINEKTADRIREENELYKEQKKAMSDREAFVQRIKDFLGLQGAANLARKAIGDSIQAIKELDAVMTEMAMVTESDIGDYWDQMEDHTQRASELGVAIKEVYEAETLYYQQGLKTNEVIALSNETLKMARIAGLSAEDATNKMTAALRGFNMELNETSAQNVADVYSELAAITAADVGQISNAMSKTASIAHSAGMEFETTAAFLSQIIETTQESAETAGTALKTVIARFQELKKNPSEIGEVEGEIVDANAIEQALRSVGVSLRDTSGQFRDLDDVFLELSSKWDSLDKNTQRYIATIAAGSRQQSRFIAMMSDYGRTQELVAAANSSSGASQEQFGKTMESLETKLEKLHNAWVTFTTGLLNQDVLKTGIDILTKILEFINKITKGFGGLTGTISKLGLLVGAFKLGQKLLSKFSNTFVNTFRKAGAAAGEALVASWRKGLGQIEDESTAASENIVKDTKSKDYSNKSRIAEDGHLKGFREFQTADLRRKKSNKLVRESTEAAFTGAKQGESMTSVLTEEAPDKKGRIKPKAQVQKGFNYGKKGKSLGSMGFTEAFDDTAIKAIENQFKESFTEITGDINKANSAWEDFEKEMSSLDAISGLEQLDQKLESIGAKKLTVTQDIQDSVITSAHEKTATAQVRATTSEAIGDAGENTSLKSAISGTTVSSGLHAGQSLENQSFTTAFGPETIKAIEAQFKQSVTSMTGDANQATEAWREFENEMGTLDAAAGLDALDAKLTKIAEKAEGAKITQITVGSGSTSLGAAAQQDAVKPTVKERVGEAIAEKTPISTMSQTAGLKKANKAIAGNRGKSTKATLTEQKISFKLDGNTLNAIEKQFKQKMKAMSDNSKDLKLSTDEINAAWKKLENNIKDKDVIVALDQIDAALQDTATKTDTAAMGMNEITNSAEVAGAAGEDALEGQGATLESVGNAASAVGGGLMGVGAAFGFIGEMFRSLGLDALADAFDTVAQVIMFVGGALMLIPPIISIINLALSTPPIGIIMLIIGAIIIGLTLIIALISAIANSNSTEKKLEEASKAADEARETAAAAKEEFEKLLETKKGYDSLVSTIENLTEGTTAWKAAVAELNAMVTELIQRYPQLAKYANWDKGYLDLSAEGWDYIIAQQEKATTAAATIAAQRQLDVEKFSKDAAEESVTETSIKIHLNYTSVDSQIKELNDLVEAGKHGTEEYYEKLQSLNEAVKGQNNENLTATVQQHISNLDAYAQSIEAYSKAELEVLRASGSTEAKASSNYNAIINSLEGQYSTLKADADTQAKTEMGDYWTDSDNGTDEGLKELMQKEGLKSTGVETRDMAELLKAKTGEDLTEEYADMGKGADDALSAKLDEAYAADYIGDVVDELYQLTEDNQAVADMYSGNLDVSILSDSEIEELEGVTAAAKQALRTQADTIEQGRKDVDAELQKLYNNPNLKADAFIGSYDAAKDFLNTYNEMLAGAGRELATGFKEMFDDLSKEDKTSFLKDYEDVNWKSSIDGARALNEMLVADNESVRTFALSTLALEESFYSATSQANELYKYLGDETMKELASDGKIAAGEIMELAKSNEKVAQMMENTNISAATLGRYYELLEEGALDAASATDDFIRVLEKLNGAANTIEDSFGFIDTFEPARSSSEISDSFEEMRDSMLELYNSGAYGDEALTDYIEAFVGADKWEAIIAEKGGDIQAAMKQVMEQVNGFNGNFQSIWQELANSGALDGVTAGEDGAIAFDFTQIGSVEELKQQIMDQGWSEEMANALIADAQTFGVNLKEGLKSVNIEEAFVEWLSTSVKNVGDQKVIDQKQFEVFMEESGLDPKVAKKALEAQGIKIQSALDGEGNLNAWVKESLLKDAKDAGTLDLSQTFELMLELGMDDTAAKKQVAALAESLTDVEFTVDGETVKEAGAEIGTMAYNGQNYGTVTGLMDGVQDEKVKAAQKLAGIEQAKLTGEAMAAASVTASNMGTLSMAKGLENVLNGIIKIANKLPGVNIGEVTKFSDQVKKNIQSEIETATGMINDYYTAEEAQLEAVINAKDGITKDKAQDIYDKIEKELSNTTPTTGTAYESPTQVETPGNKYESEYDWLYNYNQQINRLVREREKMEREYNDLLDQENLTASELLDKSKEQLASLKEQSQYEVAAIAQSYGTIETLLTDPKYSKFAKYTKYDATTQTFTDDTVGLEGANFTDDEREEYEAWRAELEENNETAIAAKESLEDIKDQVKEIGERGRDATSELYDNIKEGLINQRQQEIDELQNINDAIQSAEDALIGKLQEQIDQRRQEKQNEEAEKSLADQTSYLTYLQANSSGNNELEALTLQKQIEQSKEDLLNAKIDQSIANMQEASAQAAEQRQEQINLAQQQLDMYANGQEIWTDVQNILSTSLAEAAAADNWAEAWENTDAFRLAADALGDDRLNPIKQQDLAKELGQNGALAAIYEDIGSAAEDIGEEIDEAIGDVETAESMMGILGNALISDKPGSLIEVMTENNANLISAIGGPNREEATNLMESLRTKNWSDTGSGYKAKLDILNWRTWDDDASSSSKRSYLEYLQKVAKAQGYDLSNWGISNLSNNADISSLNDSQIDDILTRLEYIYKNQKGLDLAKQVSTADIKGYVSKADYEKKKAAEAEKNKTNTSTTKTTFGTSATTSAGPYGSHYNQNPFAQNFGSTQAAKVIDNKIKNGEIDTTKKPTSVPGPTKTGPESCVVGKTPALAPTPRGISVTTYTNNVKWHNGKAYLPAHLIGVSDKTDTWVKKDEAYTYTKNQKGGGAVVTIRPDQPIYNKDIFKYEKGGLADFTGPAWLDGTKTKPELVLNAQDTQNFIQLKDILSAILTGTGNINKNNSTNTSSNSFDIDITVESIGDDYDVEQMANKIRSMLYEDASFRNVNNVSRTR